MLLLTAFFFATGCSDEQAAPGAEQRPECTRHGVCDDGTFCNGEERCRDGKCVMGEPVACDDDLRCTVDSCDESSWACRHEAPDSDSDGHGDAACTDALGRPLGDDCDDADASRHPDAAELCDPDEIDEDCDLSTVGQRDSDEDGATSSVCCNATPQERQCGPDCRDNNPQVGPDAPEVCDGLDNDCDGGIDEGVELLLFRDQDGDHYGTGAVALRACAKVRGYSTEGGDCDDADATLFPGAPESCEAPAIDRDCNGVENDLPGGCACDPGTERPCPLAGPCSQGVLSCVDEVWSACSIAPSPELCNGQDDDCDGHPDDGVTVDCYEDEDEDGYARAGASPESVCPSDAAGCAKGYTARAPSGNAIDCDATTGEISPAAPELCNGRDDDCDGEIDEGFPLTMRYIDADGDEHAGTAVQRCATDPGSQSEADDCMDDNPLVYPEQDGIFSNPACGRGSSPCLASDGEWKCRPAAADTCATSLAPARWDYDCDGDVRGAPFVDEPCRLAALCDEGCGPSGFSAPAAETARCGESRTYQVCRCQGAQGGGCTNSTEQRPYPCH